MEANNVNTDKKVDVLNRIKELSRRKANRSMIGVVVAILAIALIVYDFLRGENQSHYFLSNITLFICGIILIYCSNVYKRISQANTSTEMKSLLKKIEIGPTGSLILAIVLIVISLVFLFFMVLILKDSFDWGGVVATTIIVILFCGFAWYILKNKNKKTKMGLLIDELQALEEEK